MSRRASAIRLLFIVLFFAWAVCPASAAGLESTRVGDDYIAGYANAVIERELRLTGLSLTVKDGVITIVEGDLPASDRDKLLASLSDIPGVMRVDFAQRDQSVADNKPLASTEGILPTGFLPPGQLFRPLMADPRWPHFSLAYRNYLGDKELKNVTATSFGESFALYRATAPFGGQWEGGLQAAVFSIFDLDTGSKDLINSDFFVALFGSYRVGNFSLLSRVLHQSSHLGDEFLLRNRTERINLSYEGVDLKLSYDFGKHLRLYGGGGLLFHQDPSDLKPWSTQIGAEFRSPWSYWGGLVTPIAGVDLQNREEGGWRIDASLRAGVEFASPRVLDRNIQLLIEYFNGRSPNGQFFRRSVEFLGLGLHLNL
jgi:hypothetical protein